MNISSLLSTLKVIDEVMKLLNDIEVHMYIYYHYTVVWEIFDSKNISWVLATHKN